MTYVERLRLDPEWAKEVLCACLPAAERRWRRRLKSRRSTLWFRPLIQVRAAFTAALESLHEMPDMEDHEVDGYIQHVIDRHIYSLLAGPQTTPRRVVRGAKRHGRARLHSTHNFEGDWRDDQDDFDRDRDMRDLGRASGPDEVFEDQTDALLDHINDQAAQFAAVLTAIRNPRHKRGLTLLFNEETFAAIRHETGMRPDDLVEAYIRWCQLAGFVVPPNLFRLAG